MTVDVQEFGRFAALVPGSRFVVLQPGNKKPVSGAGGNRVYTDASGALEAMERGNNVGIMASDDVCVIDIDDPNILPDVLFPETLSVQSRKRIGTHYFYHYTDRRIDALKSISGVCDVQIHDRNAYVVAPGSFVACDDALIEAMPDSEKPFAGRYTIQNATAPHTINYDEVPAHIRWYAHCARIPDAPPKTHVTETSGRNAVYDLSVADVVGVKRGHFANPWHGSTGGANARMVGGKLMCYRCGVSHTGFTALAVSAGIATCQSAGYEFNGGQSSVDRYDGDTLYTMWTYAVRNGILPVDAVPPARAVSWYGMKHGHTDELIDGWKVPEDRYAETINCMRLSV